MSLPWIFLIACGWLAATVSGTAGFGGALLLLPVLTLVVGAKEAVPILAVAQLLGNLSRAGFGWREIRWRPALLFGAGAIPAGILGSRLFVELPAAGLGRLIGLVVLAIAALRRTGLARRRVPEPLLVPAGAVVGFLSAVAGSAGPLGAAVFLGLHLPHRSYVASEAAAASLIHLARGATYLRFAALNAADIPGAVALGMSFILGSWTGRGSIDRLPPRALSRLVEALLVGSGLALILSGG